MSPGSSPWWQHWLIMEGRCWHLELKFSWNFATVIKVYVSSSSRCESFNCSLRGLAANQGWDNMSNHRECDACQERVLFLSSSFFFLPLQMFSSSLCSLKIHKVWFIYRPFHLKSLLYWFILLSHFECLLKTQRIPFIIYPFKVF